MVWVRRDIHSFNPHCTSGGENRVLARWACLNADDCLRGRVETGLTMDIGTQDRVDIT